MGNVFYLEEDIEFPDVYGIITDLPPWKMCYIIAELIGVQLSHEDILNRAPDPIEKVYEQQLVSFEKYVWTDEESGQFIHLIENSKKIDATPPQENINKELFEDVPMGGQQLHLLEEWSDVKFLIRTEGVESFFDPFQLKQIGGVRMIIKSSASEFKNGEKII